MKIIAIANQKGGVGKTTTAVNLAAGLVQQGVKTLLVDLDPQANASDYLGFEPDGRQTVSDLMQAEVNDEAYSVADTIRTNAEGVDYIPSDIRLSGADIQLISSVSPATALKAILNDPAVEDYDYILIDCQPSLGILLTNALAAAHEVLIPVQAQKFSLDGIAYLKKAIDMVTRKLNPQLHISGALLTMVDKTNMSRAVEDAAGDIFDHQLFETRIHKSVEAANSTAYSKSLVSQKSSRLGGEYKLLVAELLERDGGVRNGG